MPTHSQILAWWAVGRTRGGESGELQLQWEACGRHHWLQRLNSGKEQESKRGRLSRAGRVGNHFEGVASERLRGRE
jgi:hypothetical protein